MTKLEEVARAMYAADTTIVFQTKTGFVYLDWDDAGALKDGAKEQEKLLKLARAAIEALRRPNEAMTAGYADPLVATAHWCGMIDAILSEGE